MFVVEYQDCDGSRLEAIVHTEDEAKRYICEKCNLTTYTDMEFYAIIPINDYFPERILTWEELVERQKMNELQALAREARRKHKYETWLSTLTNEELKLHRKNLALAKEIEEKTLKLQQAFSLSMFGDGSKKE